MRSKDLSSVLFRLQTLTLAVAVFYNGLVFFSPDFGTIYNPLLPIGLKISKDFVTLIAILPVFWLYFSGRLRLSRSELIYFSIPIGLAAWMLFLTTIKFELEDRTLGILKNYAFYYFAGGCFAASTRYFKKSLSLFRVFKNLINLSVVIGLLIYLLPVDILSVTFAGRMVSVLGNPNLLGYLAALNIVIIHGFAAAKTSMSLRRAGVFWAEVSLNYLGLLLSMSFAAFLCFGAWIVIISVILWYVRLPGGARISSFLRRELTAFLALGALGFTFAASNPALSAAFDKVDRILHNQPVTIISARTESYDRLLGQNFSSLFNFAFGTTTDVSYVEFDGTYVSLAYNYGCITLALWIMFFSYPVFKYFREFAWVTRQGSFLVPTAEAWIGIFLATFLYVSVAFHFWIQYLPEKYPSSLFLGWFFGFLALNSWGDKS